MLIEIKNVPMYGKGMTVKGFAFSIIDTFESIMANAQSQKEEDCDDVYYAIKLNTDTKVIGLQFATQEKQLAFYELVKAALWSEQKFLSIDFMEWM